MQDVRTMEDKINQKTLEKLHRELFNNITTDGTTPGEARLHEEISEVLERFAQT